MIRSQNPAHKVLSILLIVIFIAALASAQYVLLPWITFGRIQPDLFMILTLNISVYCGAGIGAVGGFFCGVIRDMFFSGYDGIWMFIYMAAGLCSGFASEWIDHQKAMLLSVAGAGIGVFISQLATACMRLLPDQFYALPELLWTSVMPSVIYTMAVSAVIFPPARMLLTFCKGSESIDDTPKA